MPRDETCTIHRNAVSNVSAPRHLRHDLNRSGQQAVLVPDLVEDALRRAGIKKGMRVLDVDCGVGDVSLIAGDIIGPSGFVLGFDCSAQAIELAERRAVESGKCYWVRFEKAALEAFLAQQSLDAAIGRLLLMSDPVASLTWLSRVLRRNGIVILQGTLVGHTFPD